MDDEMVDGGEKGSENSEVFGYLRAAEFWESKTEGSVDRRLEQRRDIEIF